MFIREARSGDISDMHVVRMAVKENPLPRADLISEKDYMEFLFERGKGWICEIENKIAGFAIVDLKEKNVWALFVHPDHEGKNIGRLLHDKMIDWYFSKTSETIWLGTAPNTRAEKFYRRAGWKSTGTRPNGETRFEMTRDLWLNRVKM